MQNLDITTVIKHFDVHNRTEGKSPRTVEWYNEVLQLFLDWQTKNDPSPYSLLFVAIPRHGRALRSLWKFARNSTGLTWLKSVLWHHGPNCLLVMRDVRNQNRKATN